ncbi:PKD domain-containing protein [Nanoarchaeota archaeon]
MKTYLKSITIFMILIVLLSAGAIAQVNYGTPNGGINYGTPNGGINYGTPNGAIPAPPSTPSNPGNIALPELPENNGEGNGETPGTNTPDQPAEWIKQPENVNILFNSPDNTVLHENIYSYCRDINFVEVIVPASSHENYNIAIEGEDVVIQNLAHGYLGTETVTLECNSVPTNFQLTVYAPEDEFPTANAGGPYEGYTFQVIEFDASESKDNGQIVYYTWDWGDGWTTESTEDNTYHAYAEAGTYQITLTVTDDDGLTNTATTTAFIEVSDYNDAPTANFKYSPLNPTTNDEIEFEDISSDEDGNVVDWEWDFGDGKTSTSRNPEHQYEEEGEYHVTLTVWDNDGASDYLSRIMRVGEYEPEKSQRTIFSRIRYDEYTTSGDVFELTVELLNDGTYDMEDVIVTAYIADLGVWRTDGPFDLDKNDQEVAKFYLDIPTDAEVGDYDIRISASNDNFRNIEYREITII